MDDLHWTLADARRAADDGELEEWVRDFLSSEGGDHTVLAAAIALRDCFWAGPIEVDVDELRRITGPEDRLPSLTGRRDEQADRDDDVEARAASPESGSSPPPLLAEHIDGRLVLEDGNHRYEARLASGARTVWAILLFPDGATRAEWLAEHGRAPSV